MVLAFKPSKKKLSPLPPYNNGRPEKSSIASTRGTKRKRSISQSSSHENDEIEEGPLAGRMDEVSVETSHARERREGGPNRRARTNTSTEYKRLDRTIDRDKGKHNFHVL